MKPIRILFLITGLNIGGAEIQLYRLLTRLDSKHYNPVVVSLIKPGPVGDMLSEAGIPVYSLGMSRGVTHLFSHLRGAWRLYRILQREWPDILHTHMFHANILGRLVGRVARVPAIVSTIHTIIFGGRAREFAFRVTEPLSDITTIISEIAAKQFVRIGVVSAHRLRVISNGVGIELFKPNLDKRLQIRQSLRLSAQTFTWIAVGRFERPKDYPTMLYALKQVLEHNANVKLLIAGTGPLLEEAKQIIGKLGLERAVNLLGLRRDVPDLLNAADALVLSSAWEGLPNAVMEAMAAGKPVVATQVGGMPELVANGEIGFLVPAKDSGALADAMLRLMNLPEEDRRRMGLAGRKLIEKRYSLERIVQQWETLYDELLAAKGLL